jgi:hypothetical protein
MASEGPIQSCSVTSPAAATSFSLISTLIPWPPFSPPAAAGETLAPGGRRSGRARRAGRAGPRTGGRAGATLRTRRTRRGTARSRTCAPPRGRRRGARGGRCGTAAPLRPCWAGAGWGRPGTRSRRRWRGRGGAARPNVRGNAAQTCVGRKELGHLQQPS